MFSFISFYCSYNFIGPTIILLPFFFCIFQWCLLHFFWWSFQFPFVPFLFFPFVCPFLFIPFNFLSSSFLFFSSHFLSLSCHSLSFSFYFLSMFFLPCICLDIFSFSLILLAIFFFPFIRLCTFLVSIQISWFLCYFLHFDCKRESSGRRLANQGKEYFLAAVSPRPANFGKMEKISWQVSALDLRASAKLIPKKNPWPANWWTVRYE